MAADHTKEMWKKRDKTKFMSICPRNVSYLELNASPISLRVIRNSGVKVEPDIKFNEIKLSGNSKIFTNQSGDQDSFTVKVKLHKDDQVVLYKFLGYSKITPGFVGKELKIVEESDPQYIERTHASLITALDYWIRNGEPFFVVTKAVDIPNNKLWLITKNKSRTQEYDDGYVEWELTFTRYKKIKLGYFKTKTAGVAAALKQYNKNLTKSKTTLVQKLLKCDRKVLVYSKTKKVVNCVKILQEILYNAGCFGKKIKKSEAIDGWYGKDTYNAVKAFQKKNKKYNLKVTGHVNFRTYQLLCGVAPTIKVTTVNNFQSKVGKATNKAGIVNVNVNKNYIASDLAGKQRLSTVAIKSTSLVSQKNVSKTKTVKLKEAKPVKKTTTTTKKNGTKVTKAPGKSTKITGKSKGKGKTSKK